MSDPESGELSSHSAEQNVSNDRKTESNGQSKARKRRRERSSSSSESSSESNSSSSGSSSTSSSSSSSESSSSDEAGPTIPKKKAKKVKHVREYSPSGERVYLHRYLMEQLNVPYEDQLGVAIRRQHDRVRSLLVGKQACASHTKSSIAFRIDDVTFASANQQKAFQGKGAPFVTEFFEKRHKIPIQFPELPCVVQRGGGAHRSYFPLELMFLRQ